MYRIVEHSSIRTLRGKWTILYRRNKNLSPYQRYDMNVIIKRRARAYMDIHWLSRLRSKNIFFELVDDNNESCMIMPLCLIINGEYTEAHIFGDFCSTGYLDFIYADDTPLDAFEAAIGLIKKRLGKVKLVFNRINERSLLHVFLSGRPPKGCAMTGRTQCVHIPLSGSFDNFWGKLHKHTRQNIRTSYNRLDRDSLCFSIEMMTKKPLTRNLFNELYKIYWKRRARDLTGILYTYLPRFIREYISPIIISQRKLRGVFCSVLRIGGNIAGFCSGFISIDKRIVLPYLAIDDAYARYSPGGILIVNTVKKLMEDHLYTYFDLSRGGETYKYTYGGVEHYNYNYQIAI